MNKDQISGLIFSVAILLVMYFALGCQSNTKTDVNHLADRQVHALNHWFKEFHPHIDDEEYAAAIVEFEQHNRVLNVVIASSKLDKHHLTEEDIAKYAFAIIREYPGDLSVFENVDAKKHIKKDLRVNNPRMYTTLN